MHENAAKHAPMETPPLIAEGALLDRRAAPREIPAGLPAPAAERVRVEGKFLFAGAGKLYVRGVTYGTFRPAEDGWELPPPEKVEKDFALMSANGINAVRIYTPPPRWFLDAALRHGLRVMAGLPVERSAAFMDYRSCAREIESMVRGAVRTCAGHPAVLCYSIGNEIQASVVRWHGHRRIERFLERLYDVAKEEDPGGLVTYVNYPSTEYLQLPFLDLVALNVYLETKPAFDDYLARLHNIAGDLPLMLTEIGLDGLRNGRSAQAELIDWQVRSAFRAGCAGAFVYAWTDEWYRGGGEVDDWEFGITDRERHPKPALQSVRNAYSIAPFAPEAEWPRISVVVCSYNGSRTIRQCCESLRGLEYPDYEVIVVNDGSTDGTDKMAAEYGFRVISTPNRGLSSARNTGWRAATGEIVAYIDDDAYADPHWLGYLAITFRDPASANHAGVGGPNIPPPGDGTIAGCVARAPGGPSHVLLSDRDAEHIPGCNMAFRRRCLEEIGGFDPQFRAAGDDVDVCWRLQKRGWTLGFSPSAVVWHHRRGSVRAYLRQQRSYGQAEAMLERKWPEKYNAAGHLTWSGRIYSSPVRLLGWRMGRIYHGTWGLAPFQSLYQPSPTLLESLPLMPEWYLLIIFLAFLSGLGLVWPPLSFSAVLLALACAAPVVQAVRCTMRLPLPNARRPRRREALAIHLITAALHLLQPLARLTGRLKHGLTLWRHRCGCGFILPRRWTADIWSRRPQTPSERLAAIEGVIRAHGGTPVRGSDFDSWDLEIAHGILGRSRLSQAVEEHGDGRQLVRFRCWPQPSALALALVAAFAALSLAAARDGGWPAWLVLASIAAIMALRTLLDCSASGSAFLCAVTQLHHEETGDEAALCSRMEPHPPPVERHEPAPGWMALDARQHAPSNGNRDEASRNGRLRAGAVR